MFGMSMTEIVIILVIALLVLGPNELPKAAKAIGKTLREVRRAGDDLKETFEREVMRDENEPRRPVKPPEGAVAKGSPEPTPPVALAEANTTPAPLEPEPVGDTTASKPTGGA